MIDVNYILKLARLKVKEEEEKKLGKELSSILDFVNKLQEIDVSKVKPMRNSGDIKNVMREDKIRLKIKNKKSKIKNQKPKIGGKLIELAPETKDRYIKTEQVL